MKTDGSNSNKGKKMPLKGDKELLFRLKSRAHSVDEYFMQYITESIIWDNYPLPDSQYNPTNHRHKDENSKNFHATMAPDQNAVFKAFNTVLLNLLSDEDHWLLDIPRELICTHVFDSRVLLSKKGAAMVIPRGLFGNLFIVNEIIEQLTSGFESKVDSEYQMYIKEHFAEIVCYLLAETAIMKKNKGQYEFPKSEITNVVHKMQSIRYELNNELKMKIWRKTTIQQIFVILHELGHIALYDFKDSLDSCASDSYHNLSSQNLADDLKADEWAISKVRYGIPDVCGENYSEILSSILSLMALLSIVSENHEQYQQYSDLTGKRFQNLAGILDSITIDDTETIVSALNKVCHNPEESILDTTIENLHWIIDNTPVTADDYYHLGCMAMHEKDIDKAIHILTNAIKSDCMHFPSLVKRGLCYLEKGYIDKAEKDMDCALSCRISTETEKLLQAIAYQNKSICRFEQGDTNSAIRIASDPLNFDWEEGVPLTMYNLACFYARRSTEHIESVTTEESENDQMKAIAYLSQAIAKSSYLLKVAQKENDFKPLADIFEFIALVGVYHPEESTF
jgi:tetratricopeptide (TPR) repeat protein